MNGVLAGGQGEAGPERRAVSPPAVTPTVTPGACDAAAADLLATQ